MAHFAGGWPLHSDALAVAPWQIKDAEKYNDEVLKVPASYDKEGRLVFTDKDHRKRYVEAMPGNHWDLAGGYGDPRPRSARGVAV